MKLLIVEDDKNILTFLKRGFKESGYSVCSASNGEDGEYLALQNIYDVIILDWMLPLKSGLEIIQTIRNSKISTPVILLTAKGDIDDRVLGLNVGADDYLPKPFSFKELRARVEALYRRSLNGGQNLVELKDIKIDLDNKIVLKNGVKIPLTAKEYELFIFLIKHKNSIVSNAMIEEQLWSDLAYINSNVIQVTIYHLRKKIGKEIIQSYRGLGYKIEI